MNANAAIAKKFQKVTGAPPILSARRPPIGRLIDPISGPRKVRYAAFTGSGTEVAVPLTIAILSKVSGNWTSSTCPNANPKPMNDPNVPM